MLTTWPAKDRASSRVVAYVRTEQARKKLRYAGVSVVFLPIGQFLVQVFGLWLDNYTVASLLAAAVNTLPNFFDNKYFVWRLTSRENQRSQMLVFWVAVMLGVSLATLFTLLVENAMGDQTQLVRAASVFVAQVLGFGIVWVGRFLLLDRWLFKLAGDSPKKADEVIAEIPT